MEVFPGPPFDVVTQSDRISEVSASTFLFLQQFFFGSEGIERGSYFGSEGIERGSYFGSEGIGRGIYFGNNLSKEK